MYRPRSVEGPRRKNDDDLMEPEYDDWGWDDWEEEEWEDEWGEDWREDWED